MSMQFPLHNQEQHIPNITRKERKEYRTLLPSQRLPSRDTDAAIVSLIIPGIRVRSYEIQAAVLLLFHGKNRNKQLPHFYQYGKCLFLFFKKKTALWYNLHGGIIQPYPILPAWFSPCVPMGVLAHADICTDLYHWEDTFLTLLQSYSVLTEQEWSASW